MEIIDFINYIYNFIKEIIDEFQILAVEKLNQYGGF